MLLSTLLRRSFPAWVGIFAILTIFVAPVISQIRILHDREPVTYEHQLHEYKSNKEGATASSHHNDAVATQDHHAGHGSSHSSSSMASDHAACGYCVLFAYTPALFAPGSSHPPLASVLSETRIVRFVSRLISPARYTSPVVRAPPF
ncbi:DUF2946 domain-containing protein [Pectobacterium cacticida]|uniref:DUF2946 domain-containing protein n=1 Tax=Pectobacterium cacticida TaxID=69221 RepID=UPI003987392B